MSTMDNLISLPKFKLILTQAFLLLVFLQLNQPLFSSSLNRVYPGQEQTALVISSSKTDNPKLTVIFENKPLESALQTIARKAEVGISYKKKNLPNKLVTYKAVNTPVFEVLKGVLKGTHLYATLSGNREVIIIKKNKPILPDFQAGSITGIVTDAETGNPMPGASVFIEGTTIGAATNIEGEYILEGIESGDYILTASFVGYQTQTKPITVYEDDITGMNFELEPLSGVLDELIVVGYGNQSKVELTGTIARVTAEEIADLPVANINQKLQGLVSGVFISNYSGAPGGATEVIIRGQSSVSAGNSPLYIIDGAPVSSGTLGSYGGEVNLAYNAASSPSSGVLSTLNPDDIASIEILKDASAKAMYGARASNGVILITTKKGSSAGSNINLSVISGTARSARDYHLLNAKEYLMLQREAYTNDNQPIPEIFLNVDESVDTDWMNLLQRNRSFFGDYSLSVNGATDKLRYFVSGSFRNEKGIIKKSALKRNTLRVNLDLQATDNLQIRTNISLGRINSNQIYSGGGVAVLNPFFEATAAAPVIPARNEEGVPSSDNPIDPQFTNPLAIIEESGNESITDKLILSGYVNYDITPQLAFNANLSFDLNKVRENMFSTPNSNYLLRNTIVQDLMRTVFNRDIMTYNLEPFLNYVSSFGNHHIEGILGATLLEQNDTYAFTSGTNFPNEQLTQIGSAGTLVRAIGPNPYSGGLETAYSFNSVFLRVNYNYDYKYLFTATLRRDGSSRFGSNSRYGTFWAVSGGWNFYQESFLENSSIISFGKLRGSVGITGNDQIGNFPYIGFWGSGSNYLGESVLTSSQIENSDLKWEETLDFDIGLDLGFFENRLEVGITYFNSTTTDLLFSQPLPFSTGFRIVTKNIGEVRNNGFEVDLNSLNVTTEHFSWRTKLNLTFIENKIVNLPGDDPIGSYLVYLIEGESIDTYYGLDFLGVDPETGMAEYRDINNDGQITADGDRTVIGSGQSEFYGGLTNTFSYKNFTLDFFFQFVYGNEIFNQIAYRGAYTFDTGSNASDTRLNRWQQPGDITDTPRMAAPGFEGLNDDFSSRFMEDGSYARLKNLTLSYSIPHSLLTRLGLQNARIFLSGQNLLTITNYSGLDPEVTRRGRGSHNYPQTSIYSIGINVNL